MNPQSSIRNPQSLKAVVFDLDGLMFNTEELYIDVGTELLRRRGKTFGKELLDKMMGRPSAIALQFMIDEHALTATVKELLAETDEIFPDILRTRLMPMPGLLELLDALERHNISKAIATSSRRLFVDRVLTPFGFHSRFAFILTSEDIVHGKPHPEIYLKAAAQHGVAPQQMLVLEDSQNGLRAAVAAGAIAVAVPGDHSRSHDFTGAALVADSLLDARLYALLGIRSL
ncbi:MAG TPA: HAD family phosphatase [Pirellulaceae bacterium]|nr:HAD family phosphatase [Pirellulaceae bacterium]